MLACLSQRLSDVGRAAGHALRGAVLTAMRPPPAPLVAGMVADLARSRSSLIAENALLRQQLIEAWS